MKRKIRYKKKRISLIEMLFLLLTVILIFGFFVFFEKKVLPTIEEISYARSKSIANAIIDRSIQKVMENYSVTSNDFIITDVGEYNNYTANTPLITSFCTALSQELNQSMETIVNEQIEIPLGVVTEMHYFANKGPLIRFSLLPASSTSVDYETAFTSTGINQINYKIWINIAIEVQIVNPLHKEKIHLTRKVMLVDTVIGGKVPEHYFSFGQKQE